MTTRHEALARRWFLAAALIGGIVAWAPLAAPARAGDLAKLDTSLTLVPKTAAFYSSSMRLGEQVEIVANSRAWAKLMELPSVRDAWHLYQQQTADPESPAAKFEQAIELPAVSDLIGLLKDMFAQEVFIFGDEQFPEFLALVQQVSNAVQYGPLVLELTGQAKGSNQAKLQARLLLSALADNVDALEFPTTVAGFKITDKEQATRNLTNLAGLITVGCMAVPQLNGAFEQTLVDGHQFLVLSLNGEMIPWGEIPLEELEEVESEPGEADKVIAKLKKLTLVVAIGIRDDYLLVSVGPSTECLAALGSGERLIDRRELEPLKQFTGRRLAEIDYVSRALKRAAGMGEEDIDALRDVVGKVLEKVDLPEADEAEIGRDARTLAEDVKGLIPEPGAVLSFSFLTDRGCECFRYNWTENLYWDGSKPLSLLENLGGNPLLAVVWRERYAPENYDLTAKWCAIGYRYFEKYAVPQMSPHDRKEFERFVKLVEDLPARLDRANREMLIPALVESQAALVLDAKLKVRKLVKDMPDPGKPMPMLEPAIVMGVSDADLLRQGCREYRAVFEAVLDAIREVNPGAIPEFDIPEPKIKETGAGTIYSYPPPKECGVDKKIVPSIGLSDSVAVAAMSRGHALRLLTAKPLAAGGVLADPDRPRAAAFLFDFAGLVEAIRPWADFAARKIVQEQMHLSDNATDEEKAQAESIVQQVHTVLDVLQVLRTVTCETRFDSGAMVTHTLTEIRDID